MTSQFTGRARQVFEMVPAQAAPDSTAILSPLLHRACLNEPRHLPASAWLEHIPFGMFLVDLLRPRTIVELGTHFGASYCAFCQAVKDLGIDTRCYAIDTWQGDPHAGSYGEDVLAQLRAHHDPLYGAFSRLIQSKFDHALEHFAEGTIDLLHIDGYHTYEAVKHDFESWLPKLSDAGVVLFHDINVREGDFGVRRFWEEVRSGFPFFEMHHGHGLGLLAVGENRSRELLALVDAQGEQAIAVRQLFFTLGRSAASRQAGLADRVAEQPPADASEPSADRAADFSQQILQAIQQEPPIQETLKSFGTTLTQRIDEQTEQLNLVAQKLARLQEAVAPLDCQLAEVIHAVDDHVRNFKQWTAYQQLGRQLRAIAGRVIPAGEVVLVVSKGDEELCELGRCTGWHFPQHAGGSYAGHHPENSDWAIEHLEALRNRGAAYLLLPNMCFWWLDSYPGFRQHLDHHYRCLWKDGQCIIYELGASARRKQWSGWSISRRQRRTRKQLPRLTSAPSLACQSACDDYPRLVAQIRRVVDRRLPVQSTVMVVSRGDAELLQLGRRRCWHFPQTEGHVYSGHHPADSRQAAEYLEAQRSRGGEYLLFPRTAFWWLDHYREFRRYIDTHYRRLHGDQDCIIYDVHEQSWLARQARRLTGLLSADGAPVDSLVSSSVDDAGLGHASPSKAPRNGVDQRLFPSQPPSPLVKQQIRLPKPGGDLRIALQYPTTLSLRPPPETFDPQRMDLHWVLPDFDRGMGGPMAIFRFIRLLEQFGHRNTVWIRGGTRHGAEVRKFIREHFIPIEAAVEVLPDDLDQIRGDAVIATHSWTAYPVRAVQHVRERFYFVQDFEPAFHPMGAEYLLAEATYRFGFRCITSSRWLASLMQDRYGAQASRFTYAYDPAIYHTDLSTPRSSHRVAFYARAQTPRRAVELGLMALDLVAARFPSLEVDFFGGSLGRLDVSYEYVDHGVLNDRRLAALYRTAALGVVFSSTNYSLIPHEMMACGLPVVELDSESTRADFPAGTVCFAPPTPEEIADRIEQLLRNPQLCALQARQGTEYVSTLSWEQSAREIESAMVAAIQARGVADNGAERSERPQQTSSPTPVAIVPGKQAAAPIVFAAQPEYYRSVYYDLTSTGQHFEFPYTSADWSVLQALPEFVRDKEAKTCIVFRPEWLAPYPDTIRQLKAQGVRVIGYSSEPVPCEGFEPHSDQLRRLDQLKQALGADFDLLVHYDPASLGFLQRIGFKRMIANPLPVSRKLFFPEERPKDFDVCFLGKSTPHRERMLLPLKMRFSIIHVAHGLRDEEARKLMNRSKLVLNIHNEPYRNFENRVVQALFCGRPVLSEQLTGDMLLPHRDYVPFDSPDDLCRKVTERLSGDASTSPGADLSQFTIERLLERLNAIFSEAAGETSA